MAERQFAAEFAARVAAALLAAGQTTEATRRTVERFGATMGVRWGEVTLHPGGGEPGITRSATPLGVDIGRVTAAERLADRVCDGTVALVQAEADLAAIGHQPPVSIVRFALMAGAGAASLAIIFGNTGLPTLALIAIAACLGACLRRAAASVSDNPLLQPFLAALLAGLTASAAGALSLPVSLQFVAACPCMVLVPGPHFLNGMIDLARARIPIGAARLAYAGLIMIAICTGLLAGLAAGRTGFDPAGASTPVPLPLDVCAAGVAVAAYGSFFNMPWRLLPLPIAIGMTAHALHWALLQAGAGLPLGAFGACLLVGLTVAPLAHIYKVPFAAFAFAAVVSLMPGIFMFQAAADALQLIAPAASATAAIDLLQTGVTAAIILLAITAGLILPKMLLDGVLARLT